MATKEKIIKTIGGFIGTTIILIIETLILIWLYNKIGEKTFICLFAAFIINRQIEILYRLKSSK